MGLKDLNSTLDLVGGTDPIGNMASQQGPQFQLPIDNASQKHIDSLTQPSTYQYGNSNETLNPSTLDLDGNLGPSFDNGMDSTLHEDGLLSLYQYTYGDSTGEAGPSNLDINGVDNGNGVFDKGTDSTLQEDSLTEQYNYEYGQNPWLSTDNRGPAQLDLDGNQGPSFNKGPESTLKVDLLADVYQSTVNPGASYGAGQPGGTWPNVKPSPVGSNFADLDGVTPGEYINNMPD